MRVSGCLSLGNSSGPARHGLLVPPVAITLNSSEVNDLLVSKLVLVERLRWATVTTQPVDPGLLAPVIALRINPELNPV